MLTVNLEKELQKQKPRYVTPKELLLLQQVDQFSGDSEEDALSTLSRVGFKHLAQGKKLSSIYSKYTEEAAQFNQERVYHVSQLESLANKYYLRFLPVKYYAGDVAPEVPAKITQFELAYKDLNGNGYSHMCNSDNMYIMAPGNAFNLEENPDDPLLFYKINDEPSIIRVALWDSLELTVTGVYFYPEHGPGEPLLAFNRFFNIDAALDCLKK